MGGASVSSRDRVEGCSDLLSTVGKELSSETNDSPKTSDRAAIQIPCCHGVQREADGIRVSHVSIVADGPFLGKPDDTKEGWKEIAGSIAGSMSKLAKPNSRVRKNKRTQG